MYLWRNIEARSWDNFCHGKAISIKYYGGSWLRHCAEILKVAGSIRSGVSGFFIDLILPVTLWPWDWLSLEQHAKRMRRIILSSVVCMPLLCFFALSHKRHDFRKKGTEQKKCVFWFSLHFLSETFLILRTHRDIIIYVQRSSRKVPVIFVRF
jgi:hypothetical protein